MCESGNVQIGGQCRFSLTNEDDEGMMVGYDGGYARVALKKQGELP